jgi:predicted transposase YbfD/YdcC
MTKEKDLADRVLTGIALKMDVYDVDKDFQEYYQYIHQSGIVYDVKLFNDVDRKHTKYLLRNL